MDDLASLVHHADDHDIWMQLRDRFPHPYTEEDGRRWLSSEMVKEPRRSFALDIGGKMVGAIGLVPGTDVERIGAEIGYWLGTEHTGAGFTTEAVTAFTRWTIAEFRLHRVCAIPFARNAASCRVLEKAGFQLEGTMRNSALKQGELLDQLLYARVVPERGVSL